MMQKLIKMFDQIDREVLDAISTLVEKILLNMMKKKVN